MGIIRVMDDSLANKIAAGEVVERPASVIKELVENSIDAGAKRIEIEIKDAGLTLIRVADDGSGMDGEDLSNAFLRHATSKMLHIRDLFRIETLGFRGEALPSIAAVAKVEAASRTANDLLAKTIQLEGGKIVHTTECTHSIGTEIWVKNLFYNTPARLKYLKSIQTELNHISDIVNRLALAYPYISFQLIHDERELLHTNGSNDLLAVIHTIYGLEIAKKMIPFHGNHLDFKINGFLGKPEISRGSRNYVTFLVNGRYVRSSILQRALIEGYHTLLPINRYPVTVLNLQMDPTLVDVNVHPSKLEVRFSKEEELAKWLKEKVKERLLYHMLIPSPTSKELTKHQHSDQPKLDFSISKTLQVVANFEPSLYSSDPIREQNQINEQLDDIRYQIEPPPTTPLDILVESTPAIRTDTLDLEPLAQLHGTYILAQNEEGLYLIDQHAAQERINYERFLRLLGEPCRSRQILAIPYMYDLTTSEAEMIKYSDTLLQELGIIQEPFGEKSFLVREIPDWFIKGKEEAQIDEIIQLILQGKGGFTLSDIRDRSAQLMACKASIKANQYITKDEMRSLLQQLDQVENRFTCPHGRPILVHFSLYEIEKLFKRVM